MKNNLEKPDWLWWVRLYLFTSLLLVSAAGQAKTYVYSQPFIENDYGSYQIEVLHAALKVTERDFGKAVLEPFPIPLPQSREIETLSRGETDIMWCVTTDELETRLLPVRFPLLQGLGGHRIFVIHSTRQHAFPPELKLSTLKRMTSVQGSHWPDTTIMQYNNFAVQGIAWSSWFTAMYRMLQEDIIDYFPRNVVEVFADLSFHDNPHLAIETNHLLVYPSYEYFFVAPDEPELQARLQEGLKRLLLSGELAEIFNRYPAHQQGWDLVLHENRQVHYVDSNVLSYRLHHANWSTEGEGLLSELKALNAERL